MDFHENSLNFVDDSKRWVQYLVLFVAKLDSIYGVCQMFGQETVSETCG